jgi:hypothetical protein
VTRADFKDRLIDDCGVCLRQAELAYEMAVAEVAAWQARLNLHAEWSASRRPGYEDAVPNTRELAALEKLRLEMLVELRDAEENLRLARSVTWTE